MKSKTLFFNPTLLRKNLSRFSPLWACFLILLLLTGPLLLLQRLSYVPAKEVPEQAMNYFEGNWEGGMYPAFFLAIFCAGLVFKYQHKANSAYMMHAFPMNRTCLFLTNAVSGFLLYAVPVVLSAVISQIILFAKNADVCVLDGVTHSVSALLWSGVLYWLLCFLFFYGLAVFCMILSGNSIIAVLSYIALNFIGYLLPLLIIIVMKQFFYGLDLTVSRELSCLSPVLRLGYVRESVETLIWIYAAVGIVLLVLAWLHNRLRHVERAGDAMAYGWARIAFRVLFTLCCSLGIGMILALIFSAVRDSNGPSAGSFYIYSLIGGFIGWFGSSMMLERTVKVFRKQKVWLGFGIFAAALALFILGLRYDVFGFQRRIPDASRIESVEINSSSNGDSIFERYDRYYYNGIDDTVTLTSAADVETIRTIHTHALEIRDEQMDRQSSSESSSSGYDCWQSIHICYHLKGGSTLTRIYYVYKQDDYNTVQAIYARPDVAVEVYEREIPNKITYAALDWWDGEDEWLHGECRDLKALKAAILADAAAGRLPVYNSYYGYDKNIGAVEIETRSENDYQYKRFYLPETAVQTIAQFRK